MYSGILIEFEELEDEPGVLGFRLWLAELLLGGNVHLIRHEDIEEAKESGLIQNNQ